MFGMRVPPEKYDAFFKMIDYNGNGAISVDEFLTYFAFLSVTTLRFKFR
jgi:hypothetical protein